MCTVTIKIDEAILQSLDPELDSPAAIRKWAQKLVDRHIQDLVAEDEEVISVEVARTMVLETVRKEYASV